MRINRPDAAVVLRIEFEALVTSVDDEGLVLDAARFDHDRPRLAWHDTDPARPIEDLPKFSLTSNAWLWLARNTVTGFRVAAADIGRARRVGERPDVDRFVHCQLGRGTQLLHGLDEHESQPFGGTAASWHVTPEGPRSQLARICVAES